MRGIDLDGQGWVQIAYQAQNGRCILAKEQREASLGMSVSAELGTTLPLGLACSLSKLGFLFE